MMSLDEYITRCDDIAWRSYDGKVIIITEDGSQIHSLNKVASFIWELSDGKSTIGDMIASICDRFDVEKDIAKEDILSFIQKLGDKKLIQFGTHG